MRLQILTLIIACLGAASAVANTGLTSAGVDPTPANNQQNEPTLAQVAPVQGTTGTSAAGTVVPGTNPSAAAQGGTISAAGTAAGTNAPNSPAPPPATLVVTPPPPPDPATLPVSVIRPINKAGTASPAAGDAPGPGNAPMSTQPAPAPPASPPPARSATASTSSPTAPPTLAVARTPAAGTPARPDATARTAAETPAEDAADASSSGFIFYTGIGIAATILLLSLAAFFRGGGEESGKPRSM